MSDRAERFYFRDRMIAAPLKQYVVEDTPPRLMNFRDRMITAPLKR